MLNDGQAKQEVNVQGGGQSAGVPANAEHETSSYNPQGNPGVQNWQESYISRPGLDQRGDVFFAAVEMTRMPMVLTDPRRPDNPIVFCNRALLDLLQMKEEDVVGRNCRFLQGPETDPGTVEEIRQAVAQQQAIAVELINYKANGKPFWNALFMGPVFDQSGELLYWFASLIDVSDRHASRQAMLQAQKMEAIGQLTAGIAHDFNNLLHVIVGNLDIARRLCGDTPPMKAVLDRANRAAVKGGHLTQQLLSFARKQRLSPRDLDLNDVVVSLSDMLARTLGEKIDLRLDLKVGLPKCKLDPTQMEMALLNLLLNARDAMPEGGKVTVGTSLGDLGHREALKVDACAVLCVRDEGTGMDKNTAAKAVEPFFTTKGMGTGLGLAMVHGFVEQSNGKLEIDSEPGKGTCVRLIFPLFSTPSTPQSPSSEGEGDDSPGDGQPASSQGEGQGHNQESEQGDAPIVWVVEDNEDVRALAELVVSELGAEPVAACSGDEAIRMVGAAKPPDVVLTDIMMPGKVGGFELVERLKERFPHMRALVMTGYTGLMSEAATQGANLVLTKPFQLDELKSALRSMLAAACPAGRAFASPA